MNLPDGGGSDGSVIKFLINALRGLSQLLDEDLSYLIARERWNPIQQTQQGVAIFAGEGIELQREDLAEFQEAPAEFLEKQAQALRTRSARSATARPGSRSSGVPGRPRC